MKIVKTPAKSSATAEQQLKGFIAKFEPANQALIRAVRRTVRRRMPTANEMVYDNYNFFVIGYGPTERPSDAIVSIAADANGVGLCFIHGAKLPDPKGVLLGSGKQTRFVRLPSAAALTQPPIATLLTAAVAQSPIPLPTRGRGRLIIRSVSAKQRPRRKDTTRSK
jgi:Domain of unknown function (DU1801)